jgi:hypothetical protein
MKKMCMFAASSFYKGATKVAQALRCGLFLCPPAYVYNAALNPVPWL